jgi:uncharacterized protein with HEPN domain
MLNKDKVSLEIILVSIDKIFKYSSEFVEPSSYYNTKEFEASIMNFIIISEMAEKISIVIQEKYSFIDWKGIKGFRNIAAHDYFGLDVNEVWDIIHNDLPKLQKEIQEIISNF